MEPEPARVFRGTGIDPQKPALQAVGSGQRQRWRVPQLPRLQLAERSRHQANPLPPLLQKRPGLCGAEELHTRPRTARIRPTGAPGITIRTQRTALALEPVEEPLLRHDETGKLSPGRVETSAQTREKEPDPGAAAARQRTALQRA